MGSDATIDRMCTSCCRVFVKLCNVISTVCELVKKFRKTRLARKSLSKQDTTQELS